MNKLLLFATSLICLSLDGFPADFPRYGANLLNKYFNDSTIRDAAVHDSKLAFKELFTPETNNGVQVARLNPKAVSFVQDYMEDEGERLMKMKTWGKPFFDKIDAVFTQHNLPVELKYLAVIESDLKTSATSRVGAAGPWQFMAQTAKELGLKVNRKVDERRDFTKSTKAAARYLKSLYKEYGDWLLVIAAYNGGPGTVNAAIRKSGSRNFWDLQYHLPAESRNHVKKFIATHYIMEGDVGLTTLTKKETEALRAAHAAVLDSNMVAATVTGKYNSTAITQTIAMDIVEFNKLNPNFDRQLSAEGKYELRLPAEKMILFQANKQQILEQSVRLLVSTATR